MFMCTHASNQGGWGGFFTSLLSGCEFLPAQNRFFFPPLCSWNLGCFVQGRFPIKFSTEPTPQPFDGWAGSYFPHCSDEKNVLPIDMLLHWSFSEETDSSQLLLVLKFLNSIEEKNCLQYVVFGDQILEKKIWRKNHERRLRTCNIHVLHRTFTVYAW